MIKNLFNILFFIFSIYTFIKSVFYAKYEANTQNNKAGGIALLFFNICVTIFANIVIFLS